MSPASTGTGTSQRNGAMANPTGIQAPYDGEDLGSYKDQFNESLDIALPYAAIPSTNGISNVITIIKAESLSGATRTTRCIASSGANGTCLGLVETLTVLDEPPGDVFRPPLWGSDKTMIAASNFDDSWLSELATVSGQMSWADALSAWQNPAYAEHIGSSWHGRQAWRGDNYDSTSGYDATWVIPMNRALVKLAEETNNQTEIDQKRLLALAVAQRGIDWYYMHNGRVHWEVNGGFNHGKLVPIVISASLLGQSGWLTTLNSDLDTHDERTIWFAETGYVQLALPAGRNIPLFGYLSATELTPATIPVNSSVFRCDADANPNCADIGTKCAGAGSCFGYPADYLGRADGDPEGGSGCPANYQSIQTGAYLGSALAVWLNPRVVTNWPSNAQHWLDYVERSAGDGVTAGYDFGAYCSTTTSDYTITGYNSAYDSAEYYTLWNTYKACADAGTCTGIGPE